MVRRVKKMTNERKDTVYFVLPRCAEESAPVKVLKDLGTLYRNNSSRPLKSNVVLMNDQDVEEVKKWGETDSFEDLVAALIEVYKAEINDLLKGKSLQEVDSDLRKRVTTIECKKALANVIYEANIDMRVFQSEDIVEERQVVVPVSGSIFLVKTKSEGDSEEKNRSWNASDYLKSYT